MTVTELMNKRAKAWDEAKKWLDEKTDENGLMSAEDAQAYDKMEADISALTDQIERLKRADAIDSAMKKPVRDAIRTPVAGNHESKSGRASAEYASAFWDVMRVGNAAMTPEIRNALKEGTDSDGGYLVPEEFERTLITALDGNNIFRQFARKITTSGDRLIPTLETRATASWVGEEGEYPETSATFGQKMLGAHKMAVRMRISEELMSDSAFNMSAFIANEFGRAMGRHEENAFFNGTGANQPTGILNAASGAQTGVTAASATAVTFDEVFDLYYSLRSPYRGNAVFIMNDDTVKLIRKIKDKNDQYIWQPAVTGGTPDMIMGRPVYTSEFMPNAASGNAAILFGDMSYYWIADRGAYSFKRLNELYAVNGQIGFIGNKRVDGLLVLSEAAKVLKMGA